MNASATLTRRSLGRLCAGIGSISHIVAEAFAQAERARWVPFVRRLRIEMN